ncbi:MAG: hypothetical protein ACT4QG_13995 [Sporichthyaceae bacterium]
MLRTSIGGAAVALGTVLATGVALATPPHGVATFDNVARGPAVGAATASVAPGTGAYMGTYTLTPGSSTGWRTQPGMTVLAVTSGTVKVVSAAGCAAREYAAPEVAVLPAGTLHVSNTASSNAALIGYFDGLGTTTGRPLLEGKAAKAPAGCASGSHRAAAAGVSATDLGQGLWGKIGTGPAHSHIAAARSKVPDGADVLIVNIDNVLPGTSTGWYRHSPGIAFQLKGTSETYVATDTGCAKVEENVAGDAVSHVHHDLHLVRVPENSEPATFLTMYWGMGADRTGKPGLLNFAEANDFTPFLPPGCTVF